jgi:tetratricopeptide (TPR) repeat protein
MRLRIVIILFLIISCAFATVKAQQPNPELLQRYSQEGEKALAEQRYDEAAKAYEKLRDLAPNIAEIHARLGLIYYQQKNFAQAVPTLRQALKLKPMLPNLDVLLAMSLSELGRYEEALPGLQKGFKQSADTALKRSCGLQLQRAYTGLQQDIKAVEAALEMTRIYPNDPEVLYHAGRLYANYAYLTTVKLSEVAPDSIWMRQARGETYESQGYYDLAIKEYREVLAQDPRRAGIHFRIGRSILSRSKQTDAGPEAAKEFEQELLLDPTNANAAYEIGEIDRKAGEFEKAREHFETALKYYPDFQEAQVGLGRVLVTLGKPDQALPYLRKAVAQNPQDEVAWYQLSQAHKALGNTSEQQKSLAEFQRLRDRNARRQDSTTLAPRQATKQELDPKGVQ